MHEEVRNILVGAVTVIVLIVFGVMSFSSSKIEAATGFNINAVFNRIDGLQVGDEVRIAGIKIGEVSGMKLVEGFAAVVDLKIDVDIGIPSDSSAAIHTEGLFGSKFIVLEPGAEDDALKPGEGLDLTQDAVVVQDILDLIIGEAKANRAKSKAANKK
ncbi:MAG: MlaD family protein [Rhodospirillales bacterium]|jgi:phospholipid/cholesterol/gamma-HCH transport system substrate-binding protein|nr:outer membrane lipid asymmetry maintenance protein MlaD [Rhodospirillaceae bacterium]MDP6428124.1 MlaD family protein [Rhodospirillales bacterium]MDP6645176.1 MlaD family protein [Rhodospirillales bacterium]MDP6841277.1 MlaD family protein [Rhodospirillales bacterium]|tara:strand:+ start:3276 stop:3749 length:474 start_codon:yes stop_codon:yes gene_type:complete